MDIEGLNDNGETQSGSPTTPDPAAQPQQVTAPDPTAQGAAPGSEPAPQEGQMVPSYRLRQATERYRQLEAYAMQLREQLEQRAAPQAAPQQQDDPQTAAIREQFKKLFPNLARFEEMNPDQLRGLLEAAPQHQQQWEQYWTNVGQNSLRTLQSKITEVYGEKVDPVTRGVFESAFIAFVERDPEARQRYLSQDPQLVEDFWKKTTAAVLDPVRRNASAQVAQRVDRAQRLPSVPRSTNAIGTPRPPKPKTEEDMHEAAWNAMNASR